MVVGQLVLSVEELRVVSAIEIVGNVVSKLDVVLSVLVATLSAISDVEEVV
jgi:hypothetical protein